MLAAFSSAFALSVVTCASNHIHPNDCNELTKRVTADPQFLDRCNLLITCIGTEYEDCMQNIYENKKECKF